MSIRISLILFPIREAQHRLDSLLGAIRTVQANNNNIESNQYHQHATPLFPLNDPR
jgi:hypothetical protein